LNDDVWLRLLMSSSPITGYCSPFTAAAWLTGAILRNGRVFS